MWQYIQTTINTQLDKVMDTVYHRLNRKLDAIQKQTHNKITSATTKHTFYTNLVNLKQTEFSKDQINTSQLRLDYALEEKTKTVYKYVNNRNRKCY